MYELLKQHSEVLNDLVPYPFLSGDHETWLLQSRHV